MNHHHQHQHGPASFNRAFAIGIILNALFVLVEAFYGWTANSLALIADAAHNLSDVAGLVLAWGSIWLGNLKPNSSYTYGWKRASILAAFTNASVLLVAMGSLAWEAMGRLGHPTATNSITVIVVSVIGIAINLVTAVLFLGGDKHDLNIRGAFIHMVADALVSLGVVISGVLALQFGWAWIDPIVSLVIALVIIVGTWNLFCQSLHLLFDGVPAKVDIASIRTYLESLSGVTTIQDLRVWALSTSEIALTAHLIMPSGPPDDDFRSITQELHDRFEIEHVTIQAMKSPTSCPCK